MSQRLYKQLMHVTLSTSISVVIKDGVNEIQRLLTSLTTTWMTLQTRIKALATCIMWNSFCTYTEMCHCVFSRDIMCRFKFCNTVQYEHPPSAS